jgi:hypothetical protein
VVNRENCAYNSWEVRKTALIPCLLNMQMDK